MNLKNFMEDYEYGFPLITSLAFGTSLLVCGYGLTRLKRIQKLTLYGRYPGLKKSGNGNGLAAYDEERKKGWRDHWGGDKGFEDEHVVRVKWWKRMLKMKRRGW
jgi:hypothetical protein